MDNKCFPIIEIDGDYWIRISYDSINLRAVSITRPKRVQETPSGHRFDQVNAKGSIKLKSKEFWLEDFEPKKKSQ